MLNVSRMESTKCQASLAARPLRLGVLGGTFDPIHQGHLVIAQCALYELGLDRVLFVPARVQPQKAHRRIVAARHRMAMVSAAVQDNERFSVSSCEIDRDPPSYTAETLAILRREVVHDGLAATPNSIGCEPEIYFICGSDSLLDMRNWYRPDNILSQAVIAVARRPGYDDQTSITAAAAELTRRWGGAVRLFDAPRLDISSTELRDRLAVGKPVRYLIPEPVRIYINKHSLYREENPE